MGDNLFLIDGHMDLAYESIYGKFDYRRSVKESRRTYKGPETFQTTIGWPELQNGQIGIVFGTLFQSPPYDLESTNVLGQTAWNTPDDFHNSILTQIHFYQNWEEKNPDLFHVIRSAQDYRGIVSEWAEEVHYPEVTHPVGIVMLMEGAEGLRSFDDLECYHQMGLRLLGPVWGGGRWCAGTKTGPDELTAEGKTLLNKMAELNLVLDISHMRNHSALDALDFYTGTVIATHANCNALLKGIPVERHLDDETIRRLAEHEGVMGVIPFNSFLNMDWWDRQDLPRNTVTLNTVADHIDHICQLTGSSHHAAFGTDSDGGFGYPAIPEEMNDVGDLRKIIVKLEKRGYTEEDLHNIFHRNWQGVLERVLL